MTTHRNYRSWLALGGILLGSFACAGGGSGRKTETEIPATGVQLTVKNQYGFPALIYAVSAGSTIRLGKVLPGMVGNFEVPRAMIGGGPVEFLATVDFDQTARSGTFVLLPGHIVDFVISRPIFNSTATLRR
jgi:hypothetical protein